MSGNKYCIEEAIPGPSHEYCEEMDSFSDISTSEDDISEYVPSEEDIIEKCVKKKHKSRLRPGKESNTFSLKDPQPSYSLALHKSPQETSKPPPSISHDAEGEEDDFTCAGQHLYKSDAGKLKAMLERRKAGFKKRGIKINIDAIDPNLLPVTLPDEYESRSAMDQRHDREMEEGLDNLRRIVEKMSTETTAFASRCHQKAMSQAIAFPKVVAAKKDREVFFCPFYFCAGSFANPKKHLQNNHKDELLTEEDEELYLAVVKERRKNEIYEKEREISSGTPPQTVAVGETRVTEFASHITSTSITTAASSKIPALKRFKALHRRIAARRIEAMKKRVSVTVAAPPIEKMTTPRRRYVHYYKCSICKRDITWVKQHLERVHKNTLTTPSMVESARNVTLAQRSKTVLRGAAQAVSGTVWGSPFLSQKTQELVSKVTTMVEAVGPMFQRLTEEFIRSVKLTEVNHPQTIGHFRKYIVNLNVENQDFLYQGTSSMLEDLPRTETNLVQGGLTSKRKFGCTIKKFITFCNANPDLSNPFIVKSQVDFLLGVLNKLSTKLWNEEAADRSARKLEKIDFEKPLEHFPITIQQILGFRKNQKVRDLLTTLIEVGDKPDMFEEVYPTKNDVALVQSTLMAILTLSTSRRPKETIELTVGEAKNALILWLKNTHGKGELKIILRRHKTAAVGKIAVYIADSLAARALEVYIKLILPEFFSRGIKMSSLLFPNYFGGKLRYSNFSERFKFAWQHVYGKDAIISSRLVRQVTSAAVRLNVPKLSSKVADLLAHDERTQNYDLSRGVGQISVTAKAVRRESMGSSSSSDDEHIGNIQKRLKTTERHENSVVLTAPDTEVEECASAAASAVVTSATSSSLPSPPESRRKSPCEKTYSDRICKKIVIHLKRIKLRNILESESEEALAAKSTPKESPAENVAAVVAVPALKLTPSHPQNPSTDAESRLISPSTMSILTSIDDGESVAGSSIPDFDIDTDDYREFSETIMRYYREGIEQKGTSFRSVLSEIRALLSQNNRYKAISKQLFIKLAKKIRLQGGITLPKKKR